jgi:hypothetical protein
MDFNASLTCQFTGAGKCSIGVIVPFFFITLDKGWTVSKAARTVTLLPMAFAVSNP